MVMHVSLGRSFFAVVDDEDFSRVSGIKWCATTQDEKHYAFNRKIGYMHRFLMAAGPGVQVDHRDDDGLNNRRSNLRIATKSQNMANAGSRGGASRFRGVHRKRSRWTAQITKDGKKRCLGTFDTEEQAAVAYNAAARELFGEFAWQNDVSPGGSFASS